MCFWSRTAPHEALEAIQRGTPGLRGMKLRRRYCAAIEADFERKRLTKPVAHHVATKRGSMCEAAPVRGYISVYKSRMLSRKACTPPPHTHDVQHCSAVPSLSVPALAMCARAMCVSAALRESHGGSIHHHTRTSARGAARSDATPCSPPEEPGPAGPLSPPSYTGHVRASCSLCRASASKPIESRYASIEPYLASTLPHRTSIVEASAPHHLPNWDQ